MPPYADFASLKDYIDSRMSRDGYRNYSDLCVSLKWRRNYMHGIYHGLFKPSRDRADKLAKLFRDDPHIVRVLCGLEAPPPALKERRLREINSLAESLNDEGLQRALEYMGFLVAQYPKKK